MRQWLFIILCLGALLAGCSPQTSPEESSTTFSPPPSASSTTAAPPESSTTASTEPPTTTSTSIVTTTVTPGPGVEAREYSRLPVGDERTVAFTFDAAYDPAPLQDILAALDRAGVGGTFFLTGEFVEDFPESVAAIVAAGHPIGNHSYSHPDFTKLGVDGTRRELRRTAELLSSAGAADPRPLFRPPFGARNETVLARLAEEGYVSIYWTIDTLDWKPERTTEQVRRSVLDNLSPGAIVLMHVGSRQTAEILPALLEEVRERGYEFVTLREALPEG